MPIREDDEEEDVNNESQNELDQYDNTDERVAADATNLQSILDKAFGRNRIVVVEFVNTDRYTDYVLGGVDSAARTADVSSTSDNEEEGGEGDEYSERDTVTVEAIQDVIKRRKGPQFNVMEYRSMEPVSYPGFPSTFRVPVISVVIRRHALLALPRPLWKTVTQLAAMLMVILILGYFALRIALIQ